MKLKTILDWINIKIVITVAVIELIFVIFETWTVIRCYNVTADCWPWFFTMAANFPASIIIFDINSFIYDLLHVKSIWTQTAIMGSTFLIIGTLWWSVILHALISL